MSGTGFRLSQKPRSSVQKCGFLKKLSLIMTSPTPYDTHPEGVINRAKFDVNTPGSFGGVTTDKIALYILDTL